MNALIGFLSVAVAALPTTSTVPVSEPTPVPYEVVSEAALAESQEAKQEEERTPSDEQQEDGKQTKPAKPRKRREILPRVYVEELEIEIKPPVMPVAPRKDKTAEQNDFYDALNAKFDKMFAIKDRIDELEKECGKLWDEYYAYRAAYDKALHYAVDNWAMESGIPLSVKTGKPCTLEMRR